MAYATKDWLAEHGATCVPLSYHWEGANYIEGSPGELEEFFQSFKDGDTFPTTSQPSVGAFLSVFDRLTENGDGVIVITMSSKLSGTFNSAKLAQAESRSDQIRVIDSTLAAAPEMYLAELALKLIGDGKSLDEIEDALVKAIDDITFFILVDTLEYLRRGGRIGGAAAMIGNLLHIKPILKLEDGLIQQHDKVRGARRAVERSLNQIPADVRWIRVVHVLAEEKAKKVLEHLQKKYPNADVALEEIGPVIGIHVGPGTIGIAFA